MSDSRGERPATGPQMWRLNTFGVLAVVADGEPITQAAASALLGQLMPQSNTEKETPAE